MVIRWFEVGETIVPVYPGDAPCEWGACVGVTVAGQKELAIMGELLQVWSEGDPLEARPS